MRPATYMLETMSGAAAGQRHPLPEGSTSIGRNPTNTIVLPASEKLVSGFHAIIYRTGSTCILQDMQSTNGTYINDSAISEHTLCPGDIIGLGHHGPKLRLIGSDEYGEPSETPEGLREASSIYSEIPDTEDTPRAVLRRPETSTALPIGPQSAERVRRRGTGFAALGLSLLAFSAIIILMARTQDSAAVIRGNSSIKTIIDQCTYSICPGAVVDARTESQKLRAETQRAVRELAATIPQNDNSITNPGFADVDVQTRLLALMKRFGETGYEIPVHMNTRVGEELAYFQSPPARSFMRRALARRAECRNAIEATLAAANLPAELSYIAMLESGYDTNALSSAGARGMWQFMPGTARNYGLSVDKDCDERSDAEKSSRAAAEYLKDLLAIFGSERSTLLAMAAYNAGEGRLMQALRKVDDPIRNRDFWYLYRMGYLPEETARYVPKILALMIIDETPDEFGFGPRN